MALSNYEEDVVDALAAGGIGLTKGTNLFAGPLRSASENFPQKVVTCMLNGGPSPLNYCDGTAANQLRYPVVQILIRSDPHGYEAGRNLVEQVYETLHDTPPAGYIGARFLSSGPGYIGSEDNGNHVWSLNLQMWINE